MDNNSIVIFDTGRALCWDIELETIPRLSVEGLPETVVAHLALLIEDYRNK